MLAGLPPRASQRPIGPDMLRAEIRSAVDAALAENGYSRGYYSWFGATLRIWDMLGSLKHEIRLPSGTSKKRLIERLSTLPVNGDPRLLPVNVTGSRDDGYRQLDIEDAIRDAR